jgi:uroporphyrinogen decarboxylase
MAAVKALIACSRELEFFSNSASLSSQCGASSTQQQQGRSLRVRCKPYVCRAAAGEGSEASGGAKEPLLLRVARGEEAERTPVWLMRQAGRYMADFRKFSDKLSFRERSETAEIAIELSLQPWLAFQTDGVIMFSDILTPLPALGIEFNMIKGKGPVISSPVRTLEDVKSLRTMDDPDQSLPFIREILSSLRKEVDGKATLLGFVGTPWTLAAYAMEGMSDKSLVKTKTIMLRHPEVLHAFLRRLTDMLVTYVCHQIDSGAQIVQLFDSWAHHLSPEQFSEFSWPYAEELVDRVKSARPNIPLIFHANGGTGKLHIVAQRAHQDVVVGLDWATEMREARSQLGAGTVLQGNVDPMVLFGPEDSIRRAVEQNIRDAGGKHHILNVGHGVIQGTPEDSVKFFCQLARESGRAENSSSHNARSAKLLQV